MMLDKKVLHDAVICKEKDNILEVSRIMRDTKSRHLIVVDKNLKPLGIISPFDINNRVIAEEKSISSTTASQIMTKPIETIELSSSYEKASEKMIALETFTLPVTENGKLVGVLDYSVVFRNVREVKNDN
jgi:signal-transduction protein with cAMP-binding, CBS, and nucleotidyltransferase domain